MIKMQFTLVSNTGKYRPMSTILEIESAEYYLANKKAVQKRAIEKICKQRMIDGRFLKEYGYTAIKTREYDKEKIDRENAERYEKIKKERGWI